MNSEEVSFTATGNSLTAMNEHSPPSLPSPRNSKPGKYVPMSPADTASKKSPCPSRAYEHRYDQVILPRETEENQYQELKTPKASTKERVASLDNCKIDTRLEEIKQAQTHLRQELSQFRAEVITSVTSMQMALAEVKDRSRRAEERASESSRLLLEAVDKLSLRLMENSDHLGKQILDVRRDIFTHHKSNITKS